MLSMNELCDLHRSIELSTKTSVSIALIGCSGPKLKEPSPARHLYTSQLFRSTLMLAERRHDAIYIISTKYGLVTLDQMIEPYDLIMSEVAKEWKTIWGARIWSSIQSRHVGTDCHVFIYAGKDYAQPIRRAGSSQAVFYEPLAQMQIGQRLQWLCAQSGISSQARAAPKALQTPKHVLEGADGNVRSRSLQRMSKILRVPAIEVRQGERLLYTLAIEGKSLPQIATVSRIRRTGSGQLTGYQRPEVLSHIKQIQDYLESEAPLLPNAIVIAFDSRVSFTGTKEGPRSDYSRVGELSIPIDPSESPENRPGFVVDGQQRLAAIRDAKIASFPICVSAFIVDKVAEQTEQFILVNSTKPLPKGLIYELLPGTEAHLPHALERRRVPATILARLNLDDASPLKALIQTETNPDGIIKDNSILKMLEYSFSDGFLYRIRQEMGDDLCLEPMLSILFSFWSAVSNVFAAEWCVPPKRCRLLHGAGVVCLGFLMDAISDRHRPKNTLTKEQFAHDLAALAPICRWSEGYWDFGSGQKRKWNEIQNTSKDIQLLSNYLLRRYKEIDWSTTSRAAQSSDQKRRAHTRKKIT